MKPYKLVSLALIFAVLITQSQGNGLPLTETRSKLILRLGSNLRPGYTLRPMAAGEKEKKGGGDDFDPAWAKYRIPIDESIESSV